MSEFKKNHNLKTFKNDYKSEIEAIKNDTNHPIHKLANELVNAKYNIEEAITSSHIYFFSELHFKSCFNEYTKHLGGDLSNLVVLKIHQDDIIDMKEDLSDYRCCMTEHRVPANKIQVINNIQELSSSNTKDLQTKLNDSSNISTDQKISTTNDFNQPIFVFNEEKDRHQIIQTSNIHSSTAHL